MAQRINEVVPIALRRGGFAVGFPSFHAGQNHTDLLSDEAVAFFDREGLEIVLALAHGKELLLFLSDGSAVQIALGMANYASVIPIASFTSDFPRVLASPEQAAALAEANARRAAQQTANKIAKGCRRRQQVETQLKTQLRRAGQTGSGAGSGTGGGTALAEREAALSRRRRRRRRCRRRSAAI